MSLSAFVTYFFVAVGGLIIGSFLNVCAIRLTSGESIAWPPSHCPQCKSRLRASELLPLLSYLWQRGRCNHCAAAISRIYPLGEAMTALLFVLMVWQVGFGPELPVALILSATLVVALVSDLKTGLIPLLFVVPALVCMLGFRIWTDGWEAWQYGIAVAVMYALFWFIDGVYGKWQAMRALAQSKEEADTDAASAPSAFGGGDIWLFLFLAATLGLPLTLLCLFFASLFGLLFYWLGIGREGETHRGAVRFAPAILPAAVISYLWGEWLFAIYFTALTSI